MKNINNMADIWLEKLKNAQKTCLVQDERRKIHYTFQEGLEMAEEYDIKTGELLVRKWKKGGALKASSRWEFEVGEEPSAIGPLTDGISESLNNPIFIRKDEKKAFQWRIRNLPYPLETYDIEVDSESNQIITRTTNKKYYKRFNIPDLDRCKVPLLQENISHAHANNTLIIKYTKPDVILSMEKQLQSEFKKIKTISDGDVECNPS